MSTSLLPDQKGYVTFDLENGDGERPFRRTLRAHAVSVALGACIYFDGMEHPWWSLAVESVDRVGKGAAPESYSLAHCILRLRWEYT